MQNDDDNKKVNKRINTIMVSTNIKCKRMQLSAQSVQFNLPEISGKNKGLNTRKIQIL